MDLQQIKTAFANLAPHQAIFYRTEESWLVMADRLYIKLPYGHIIPVEQDDGSLYGSPEDYLLGNTCSGFVVDTISQVETILGRYEACAGATFSGFDTEGNWHENVKIVEVDHTNFGEHEFADDEVGDCHEIYFYLDRWVPTKWGDSQCFANAATIMCREMVKIKRLTDKEMA